MILSLLQRIYPWPRRGKCCGFKFALAGLDQSEGLLNYWPRLGRSSSERTWYTSSENFISTYPPWSMVRLPPWQGFPPSFPSEIVSTSSSRPTCFRNSIAEVQGTSRKTTSSCDRRYDFGLTVFLLQWNRQVSCWKHGCLLLDLHCIPRWTPLHLRRSLVTTGRRWCGLTNAFSGGGAPTCT